MSSPNASSPSCASPSGPAGDGVTDRRRFLSTLLASVLAACPTAAAPQMRRVPRVGFLTWGTCPGRDSVFGMALRELGHTWGQTIEVICQSAEGSHDRLAHVATTLAAENVDVVAALTHVTAHAARRVMPSTPIVMIASGDPVRTGLVASLSRPGGQITGLTYYSTDLVAKRLQLLKEMVPGISRVALLENPESAHVFGLYEQDAEHAAHALGLRLLKAPVSRARDLDSVIKGVAKDKAHALLVLTDPMLGAEARRIAELAALHRLPAMYWARWFVEAGGLAAYSADYDAMVRRAAHYVDRILKGTRPGDLPVEQPTRFEFVINLKAANALGLTIPPSMLARADHIIE
jgi:putative ABC transport system substrate-binding protein